MKKNQTCFTSAVAALVIFILTTSANAQTGAFNDSKATRLGVGISAGIPTTDGYKFAIGGDLRLQQDFKSNLSGLFSVGYNNFSLEDGFSEDNLGYIPVKIGLKVFPVQRFYFSAEAGAVFGTQSGSDTQFIYAPGIGVGTNTGVDIGLRYEGITGDVNGLGLKNPGQVALRLAYGFNLNK